MYVNRMWVKPGARACGASGGLKAREGLEKDSGEHERQWIGSCGTLEGLEAREGLVRDYTGQ